MKRRFLMTMQVLLLVAGSSLAGAYVSGVYPALPNTDSAARAAVLQAKALGYHNVLVVSPSGGDYTSVQNALDSITDNSETNRYLVWVGPGIYTERVTMKPLVDIEGAGENLTKITFSGSPSPETGTVVGASNSALRSLTIENTGGYGYAYATGMYNHYPLVEDSLTLLHVTFSASGAVNNAGVVNDLASIQMTDVTIAASGGTNSIGASYTSSHSIMTNVSVTASDGAQDNVAVGSFAGELTMTNVTARASGGRKSIGVACYGDYYVGGPCIEKIYNSNIAGGSYGFYTRLSFPEIHNTSLSGDIGVYNYGMYRPELGVVLLENSAITGNKHSVVNGTQLGGIFVGASKLSGGPASGVGVRCADVHDENYIAFSNTCP